MSSFSVCYCRAKLPVNMHCPLVMLVRRMLNWRDKKVIKVTCSQQDKRELRLLRSNRPILLMFMQLEFFALIKEVFTSVDYSYNINFKRWTVFCYSDSEYMLLYLINRDINVRFKGIDYAVVLCRTNAMPTTQLLAILTQSAQLAPGENYNASRDGSS